MSTPVSESIALLTRIAEALEALLALSRSKKAAQVASTTATDAELDDPKWGDPLVKFLPRDWTGDEFRQTHFSATTPEFLDALAESYSYFARKNDESGEKATNGKPKSYYDRKSERLARGWAARLRAGWKSKASEMMNENEVNW